MPGGHVAQGRAGRGHRPEGVLPPAGGGPARRAAGAGPRQPPRAGVRPARRGLLRRRHRPLPRARRPLSPPARRPRPTRGAWARIGVTGAFVVNEGGGVTEPALRLTQGQTPTVYPGRWLSVGAGRRRRACGCSGKRYRGRMLVYLNDRGALNLINELPVEDYLRGVVPSEMGPELYNQLEALKAQAVAARTYTLRNLGEFAREGYDICATPRCQVYGGMEVEHPLSDRADRGDRRPGAALPGRAGRRPLQLDLRRPHRGRPRHLPPASSEPYLKAVPCMEAGIARIDGDLAPGDPFPAGLTRRLLPPAAGASPVAVARRPPGAPGAARRPARAARAARPRSTGARCSATSPPPSTWRSTPGCSWRPRTSTTCSTIRRPTGAEEDRRRAAYLIQQRPGQRARSTSRSPTEEVERMLLALAELLRVVRREEVSFFSRRRRQARRPLGQGGQGLRPAGRALATFRRQGDDLYSAALALVPGDHLTLFWQGDRLVAANQEIDLDGVAFDRSSPYSAWTRFRTDSQLATQVNTRFPGLGFQQLRGPGRGASRAGWARSGSTATGQDRGGRRARRALDPRRAGHPLHRQAPGAQEPGARLALHRPRLRPRRRHVPGGSLRHGPAGPHLPRDPHPLLHRRRAGEGALEAARRRRDE